MCHLHIFRYAVHPDLPTGVCVSLIKKPWRSLVADLGAANVYTLDDLKQHNLPLNTLKIIYIEGFFITHSFDVALELVKLARENGIVVAFNISGEYLFQVVFLYRFIAQNRARTSDRSKKTESFQDHHAAICEMVGFSGILFGNGREMTALARVLNLKYNDVEEIPFLLNNLKRIAVGASSRNHNNWFLDGGIVVMTQGGKSPAIVVWGEGESAQVLFNFLVSSELSVNQSNKVFFFFLSMIILRRGVLSLFICNISGAPRTARRPGFRYNWCRRFFSRWLFTRRFDRTLAKVVLKIRVQSSERNRDKDRCYFSESRTSSYITMKICFLNIISSLLKLIWT